MYDMYGRRQSLQMGPKTFKEAMDQLSMVHVSEIQEVKLRLDHLQTENRLLRTKMREKASTGRTQFRRTQKSMIRTGSSFDGSEFPEEEEDSARAGRVHSKSPAESDDDSPKSPKDALIPTERSTTDHSSNMTHAKTLATENPDACHARKSRLRATRIVGQVDNEVDMGGTPKTSFLIREIWMRHSMGGSARSQQQVAALQRSQTSDRLERERRFSMTSEDDQEMVGLKEGIWKHIIGSPTSPKRMLWDALGGVMILWDIVALPLMVFQEVDGPFMDALGMIGLLYWTMNVVNTLTCGYLQNGVTVMSPWLIFKKYLSRTIFIDLVTLVPDWVVTMVSLLSTGNDFQEARLLRALRAFRLTRLVRIVKLRWLMEVVRDYLDSEYASIMFEISKMMGLLLVINHVLACAWFGFSLVSVELGWNTWSANNILSYGIDSFESSWIYAYLTCLHWSLCQFTPASMEVQPANPLERGFAALTVLFALIVFSYIVGSITGSLTQLRMMSETITRETLKLRRFLRRNAVPIGLSLRIRRFVEFELKRRQQPVNQQSVGCLAVLSEQLQLELSFALVQPTLNTHALFEALVKSNGGSLLMEKASQHFEKKTLAMDDWEFLPYTPATAMRFLLAGQLRYVRTIDTGDLDPVTDESIIDPGRQWISEAVMWIADWEYVGELSATIESHLLLISPKCILSLIDAYPVCHKMLKNYANDFVMWVSNLSPEEMTDVLEPIIVTMLMKSVNRAKTEKPGGQSSGQNIPRATV